MWYPPQEKIFSHGTSGAATPIHTQPRGAALRCPSQAPHAQGQGDVRPHTAQGGSPPVPQSGRPRAGPRGRPATRRGAGQAHAPATRRDARPAQLREAATGSRYGKPLREAATGSRYGKPLRVGGSRSLILARVPGVMPRLAKGRSFCSPAPQPWGANISCPQVTSPATSRPPLPR